MDSGAYTWEQSQQRHRNQAPVWGGRLEQEKAVLPVLEDVEHVLHQSQALVALTCTRFEGRYCFTTLKPLLCTSSLAQRQQKQQARDCERVIWVLTKSNRAEGRTTEDEGEIPKLVFLLPSLIWLFHQQPSIPFLLYSLFSTQTPNSPFPPHLQIPLLYPITLQLPLTHP